MTGIRRALGGLLRRPSSKPAERPPVEQDVEPVPAPGEAGGPATEPTVDERGARAILASSPPPLPPEPKSRAPVRTEPTPSPEPEPAAAPSATPREWNLWELQRAVREAAGNERHEEWSALLIHLREFANADGELPAEFDTLVRESFGPVLDELEPATAS
ncbi:MAG TPA: hypothetical protein VG144_04285 [Gaiellaceae bacterium]|nr:hypothetical protein [Gaiellaceae bacterium]